MKPETDLPWEFDPSGKHYAHYVIRHNGQIACYPRNTVDALYIVHACNAYPKLIRALKACTECLLDQCLPNCESRVLIRELGEED